MAEILMESWIAGRWNSIIQHFGNPLFKNAYLMMLGTVAHSFFGFIFWIIAARLYTVEVIGLSSAIVSSAGLLAILSDLGLSIGLIRFLPAAGENSNDLLNTFFTIIVFASILIASIFLAGLDFWSPALLLVRQNMAFTIVFVVFAVISTLQNIVYNAFIAKRKAEFMFISNIISSLLKIALVTLFAVFLNSTFGFFITISLTGAISLVISIYWFLPRVQNGYRPIPKIKKEILSKSLHYSINNYVGRCLLQMTPLILPLMVVNILSAEMNAYFVIAWSIASVLFIIPASISTSLFAEGSNNKKLLLINSKKSMKLVLLLLLPLSFILFILAGKLLQLFGQAYSDNSAFLLGILALSSIPYGINYLYINIARVNDDVISIIIVTMAATFLSLGLSCFLMLKMGLVGIGMGYLMGQSTVAIGVLFIIRRDIYRIQPIIKSIGA